MALRRRKLSRSPDGTLALETQTRGLPETYGGRGGTFFRDMYADDHVETQPGGRFRWMLSTCLAAAVGAVAILIVINGSAKDDFANDGLLPGLKTFSDVTVTAAIMPTLKNADGLKWAMPKSDRMRLASGSMSTRYIIHESSKSRREGREYVRQKPYARIVARLAPVPPGNDERIPAFNPFTLYAGANAVTPQIDDDEKAGSGLSRSNVTSKVVELLGGILPGEDGQELDDREVLDIIERTASSANPNSGEDEPLDGIGGSEIEATSDAIATGFGKPALATYGHVTVIHKSDEQTDDADLSAIEDGEVRVVKVGPNDTLSKILISAGAPSWQARSMIEAAQPIFPESALVPGQEIRITVVPSLVLPDAKEPARFTVFSDGHDHLVTVTRNSAGEFDASKTSLITEELRALSNTDDDSGPNATLYASVYNAGLMQSLSPETVRKVLAINAFDVDFRRRVRPGDTIELFFDMKNLQSTDGPPGELLYTALGSGGDLYKFYRFRTHDGVVDYYDENGNNSKKFLLRKPVRAEDVRLTSGFGLRYHPLLNTRKMHTGVDWAAPSGTPIIAAGNGTIEEIGRKGYYGNYIRVRHANGYKTAYGHMRRFASSLSVGSKVRQGQTIGYIGSTGLSSGPHLHYEVLVNSRRVNPMSIQVPRERKLSGADLAAFQRERARIDELMRRAPVMTANK